MENVITTYPKHSNPRKITPSTGSLSAIPVRSIKSLIGVEIDILPCSATSG